MRIEFKSSVKWRFKTHEDVKYRVCHFILCGRERICCLCAPSFVCPSESWFSSLYNKPQLSETSMHVTCLFFILDEEGVPYSCIYRWDRKHVCRTVPSLAMWLLELKSKRRFSQYITEKTSSPIFSDEKPLNDFLSNILATRTREWRKRTK